MTSKIALFVLLLGASCEACAEFVTAVQRSLNAMYTSELGELRPCKETALNELRICSDTLRNDGNAPFVRYHDEATGKVAVLVHGLSDSPFYIRGVAEIFYRNGYDVIVPLLPGHGLREADADMSDSQIAERWQAHVADVIQLAVTHSQHVVVGGFSTGGALTSHYVLNHSENIRGLVLFSGALALSENAEGMSKIWGIKWLAKLLDGNYQSHGPNPYKYPAVASFAGLELMDIINAIRSDFDAGKRISVPVFAAHSQSDVTTPIVGINTLLKHSDASNSLFVIDEAYQTCHADVVVNQTMLKSMQLKRENFDRTDRCAMPKANPQFSTMAMMLEQFLNEINTR